MSMMVKTTRRAHVHLIRMLSTEFPLTIKIGH